MTLEIEIELPAETRLEDPETLRTVDEFSQIWSDATVFKTLRDTGALGGKCGVCEFSKVCLGCHNMPNFAMPGPDGQPRSLHVTGDRFNASVHGI